MKHTNNLMSCVKVTLLFLLAGMIFSCAAPTSTPPPAQGKKADASVDSMTNTSLVETVLTAEEQAKLTPDTVLQILKEGNMKYVNGDLTVRDHTERIRKTVSGQYPKAVVLSCMDSRVPVEDVFNRGLGSLFVIRIAGNIVNEDILGSMEYGCKVSGSKLILVLGHEYCGAIKAGIDDVELGNITPLLARIRPAIKNVVNFQGEKTSKNNAFVHEVCMENIKLAIATIRSKSPILKKWNKKEKSKLWVPFIICRRARWILNNVHRDNLKY